MRISEERKRTIISYMLEKISVGTSGISNVIADTFDISTNTVHTYLNELIKAGIIEKEKRGAYKLVSHHYEYTFKRSEGGLNSDTYAYDTCVLPRIKNFPDNVQHIWAYAISEMVNNVIDHSEAENMNLIVVQTYLTTYVVIADDGIGIFEKIKKHFSLSSHDEAICELFKGKLTTDADNHSGEGIFFTSKMMDSFVIISGEKIFTTSKFDNDNVFDIADGLRGTSVFMCLSNFTHKSAREIFDIYSNVDGGFTKTRIPLKNIFDSAPVSRSQAKRVCNRLEEFQEIIIDFDEISWMGQGFAHQMFVVYKNAHPDVKLIPINMSEDVQRMYNHVISS